MHQCSPISSCGATYFVARGPRFHCEIQARGETERWQFCAAASRIGADPSRGRADHVHAAAPASTPARNPYGRRSCGASCRLAAMATRTSCVLSANPATLPREFLRAATISGANGPDDGRCLCAARLASHRIWLGHIDNGPWPAGGLEFLPPASTASCTAPVSTCSGTCRIQFSRVPNPDCDRPGDTAGKYVTANDTAGRLSTRPRALMSTAIPTGIVPADVTTLTVRLWFSFTKGLDCIIVIFPFRMTCILDG